MNNENPNNHKTPPISERDQDNWEAEQRLKPKEGWQPIESAPMDGTSILVHNNIAAGCPGGVADECWAGNTDVAAWWAGEGGGKGSWVCYMSAVLDPNLHFEPTHWMPLPEPPK